MKFVAKNYYNIFMAIRWMKYLGNNVGATAQILLLSQVAHEAQTLPMSNIITLMLVCQMTNKLISLCLEPKPIHRRILWSPMIFLDCHFPLMASSVLGGLSSKLSKSWDASISSRYQMNALFADSFVWWAMISKTVLTRDHS